MITRVPSLDEDNTNVIGPIEKIQALIYSTDGAQYKFWTVQASV